MTDESTTILVVDDEPHLLDYLCEALQAAGHDVLPATSAGEALNLFFGHGPRIQLVISDVWLPETDGIELVGMLTRLKPSLRFIYVSASPPSEVRKGPWPYLQKPFRPASLLSLV